MMENFEANCSVFDCYDAAKLLQEYNKVHFMNINCHKQALKELVVETSNSVQMVLMLEQIKYQGDFDEADSKWEMTSQ